MNTLEDQKSQGMKRKNRSETRQLMKEEYYIKITPITNQINPKMSITTSEHNRKDYCTK